jgi:hypothetical protein
MSVEGRFLVRTLSNKPSFKVQRSPVDRADSLQLLSNMVPGEAASVRLPACMDRPHGATIRRMQHPPGAFSRSLDVDVRIRTPTCKTNDRHDAGQPIARNVVVATSLEPEAAAAVKWAAQQLCQKGDAVYLVHVATCMSTPAEVRSCSFQISSRQTNNA